jgi:hypothetical protein
VPILNAIKPSSFLSLDSIALSSIVPPYFYGYGNTTTGFYSTPSKLLVMILKSAGSNKE